MTVNAKLLAAQSFYKTTSLLRAINDVLIAFKLRLAGRDTPAHRAEAIAAGQKLLRFLDQVPAHPQDHRGYDPRTRELFTDVARCGWTGELKNLLGQAESLREDDQRKLVGHLENLQRLVVEHQLEDQSELFESC
jgi:hypothetical protein